MTQIFYKNINILSVFFMGFFLIIISPSAHSQDALIIKRLDENQLAIGPGSTISADPTAHSGSAIVRAATAGSGTFWFGPYSNFEAGNYFIQFRMKVSSSMSPNRIITIDAASYSKGLLKSLNVTPSMFRVSGEWQLITFPLELSENVTDLEIRGIDFVSGIADLSLDYINMVPGDLRGFYSDEFSIDSKGNISIGRISSSGYKLAVAGGMISESVKVQSLAAWPDYVFNKDYKLPQLKYVESYIKDKGHLPDIPSASEVNNNGIDLGDINAKLLKKIEELTLYLLEKNRQVLALEKRVSSIEQKSLTKP